MKNFFKKKTEEEAIDSSNSIKSTTGNNLEKQPSYVLPGVLVTTLFFLWGFSYGLLDTLNKHFRNVLGICKY